MDNDVMTCDEAIEFTSALLDGEIIPRGAAEHTSSCTVCQERLRIYAEISVELRRVASREPSFEIATPTVNKRTNIFALGWNKSWQSIRVPRLALASLVILVAALSLGLTVIGVRAHGHGSAVLLKVSSAPGQSLLCPLSAVDKKWDQCGAMSFPKGVSLGYQFQLLSVDGDRIRLGFRGISTPRQLGHESFEYASILEQQQREYSFTPGETLEVQVPGFGPLTITGEWLDHIPALASTNNPNLDPDANELRIVSPLLVRDKEIVEDWDGAIVTADKSSSGVDLYSLKEGRFVVSPSQLPGAIQGSVKLNRIAFESDGHQYEIVTGTPITRDEQVWILRDAAFKPEGINGAYSGPVALSEFTGKTIGNGSR